MVRAARGDQSQRVCDISMFYMAPLCAPSNASGTPAFQLRSKLSTAMARYLLCWRKQARERTPREQAKLSSGNNGAMLQPISCKHLWTSCLLAVVQPQRTQEQVLSGNMLKHFSSAIVRRPHSRQTKIMVALVFQTVATFASTEPKPKLSQPLLSHH